MSFRTTAAVSAAALALLAGQAPAVAADGPASSPGAAGIGDPYFPADGNGGYDVEHYDLDLTYDPATDVLDGVAEVTAVATQDLSRLDLDLQGLDVRDVAVDGRPATWTRSGQELVITPAAGVPSGREFVVAVTYSGVPALLDEAALGQSGVFTTADGMVAVGQPHGAATWFPVNDHPLDAGVLPLPDHRPRGAGGRGQRLPRRRLDGPWAHDVDLVGP